MPFSQTDLAHGERFFTDCAVPATVLPDGESVKTVAAILGHSDETETLRTYSHLWPDSDTRTRAAVDAIFTPAADSLRTRTNNTLSDLHVYYIAA